ncbi:hypothetical protein [Streptomyces sp. NPDC002619]|uniref:hypothetical protein n=1 Tax=Streptomyces sp. NPDC002619 TaxID=3364655 RepID=UPI003691FFED
MTPTESTPTSTQADGEGPGEHPEADTSTGSWRPTPRRLLIGGIALLTVTAVVLILAVALFGQDEEPEKAAKIPTYDVTYTVTGTAKVSVSVSTGSGPALRGGTLTPAQLPWTKHISMPADGTPPTMDILLGEKGGHAECTLRVHGRPASRSVAEGTFGRATCSAPAPTTAPPVSPSP